MNEVKIMITAWGTRGDIEPVINLAQSLMNKNYRVLVFSTRPYTTLLEQKGIPVIEALENTDDFLTGLYRKINFSDRSFNGTRNMVKKSKAYFFDKDYQALSNEDMARVKKCAEDYRPDILLCPNAIYGMHTALAEMLEIPVVTYDFQINHPTSQLPPFTLEARNQPFFLNQLMYWIKSRLYPKSMKPRFDHMRELCNLDLEKYKDGSAFISWPHNLPQMLASDPILHSRPTDWPEHKIMTGWWFNQSTEFENTPNDAIKAFLALHSRDKPVFITFGSMHTSKEDAHQLAKIVFDALYVLNKKGIIQHGAVGLSRELLNRQNHWENILYRYAEKNTIEIGSHPHDAILPYCESIVHHGGAGTTSRAIKCGIPQVIISFLGDQPFHGSLVQSNTLGGHLGTFGMEHVTGYNLSHSLNVISKQGIYRASVQNAKDSINPNNGTENAISFIEKMANEFDYPWPTRRPGTPS